MSSNFVKKPRRSYGYAYVFCLVSEQNNFLAIAEVISKVSLRENNEIKFSIPDDIFEINEIQSFVDFIRFREITSKSKASQKDVDILAEEINQSWWDKNKNIFEK